MRTRRLAGTGALATLAAMVATTLVAALARAVGVELEVPEGGETIPLSGIAFVTGVFSVVGVVIAAALLRWSAHPVPWFVRTTIALTAVSLVPPWSVGAATATAAALVVLHVTAATVMIPSLAWSLGRAGQAVAAASTSTAKEISTAAPSTSPVTPPSRRTQRSRSATTAATITSRPTSGGQAEPSA